MALLCFDTALGSCSVAVGENGRAWAARFEERDTGQAEVLLPMTQAVLAEAGVTPAALAGLAVTVGPGSFTGTRIGLAAARAMGTALGIPVAGFTTFEAVAEAAGPGAPLLVAFDARRDQLYAQSFDSEGQALDPGRAASAVDIVNTQSSGEAPLRVAGSGAPSLMAVLAQGGVAARLVAECVWPDARYLLNLAARRRVRADDKAASVMPKPLYLRSHDGVPKAPIPVSKAGGPSPPSRVP